MATVDLDHSGPCDRHYQCPVAGACDPARFVPRTAIAQAYGHHGTIPNAEAFGYMLRALFESLRRHMAVERHMMLTSA
ncbi:hypothetical protein [Pararhizobium mangrovi]|uniref:Hemerythrin-like domain-containing protein n=1 Tax=Pararhizobium mangrovi TaxID=2590452 RepID=A0A506UES2_9HYPH|nr:hypothetical protein [Pararhizobium mangrovi]TPW31966.1 hypothetical protein FJU11_01905 [Pararhizobium mangrovi]